MYYENEENIKKLEKLKEENEKMTTTIAEADVDTEEFIQRFKNVFLFIFILLLLLFSKLEIWNL